MTKQKILDAAIQLFSRKGFRSTSLSDLAQATGLTKGALYHHFRNKDALFYAVLENLRFLWRERVFRDMLERKSALERLEILFDNHARLIEERETFCLVLSSLVMEMDSVNAEFMDALREIFADLTALIQRIVEKGQENGEVRRDLDPHLLALNLVGMMEGNSIPWILNRGNVNYQKMSRTQRQILLGGLKG
ncbi:MAG: TetR/AcrR family transcriptional regulator [Bacteroidota bacterium]